ncbi:hypothetical protein AB0J40_14330 [Amycolatopsis sp. NPDC049691]|uniref:hypothetical protein n=1 Tax=Amycolatopsis sp. NPDC049691 TaxID=3155155 RepID=UPI003427D85B
MTTQLFLCGGGLPFGAGLAGALAAPVWLQPGCAGLAGGRLRRRGWRGWRLGCAGLVAAWLPPGEQVPVLAPTLALAAKP